MQRQLGVKNIPAFDVHAACSGFIYAMEIGQQFIMSRTYETVLIIGAEKLSTIVNWNDRNTCVLFGDGCGAVVLEEGEPGEGVLSTYMQSDGGEKELLYITAGGSLTPLTAEGIEAAIWPPGEDDIEVYLGRCPTPEVQGEATKRHGQRAERPHGRRLRSRHGTAG